MRTQRETDLEQEVERLTNELQDARALIKDVAYGDFECGSDAPLMAQEYIEANKQDHSWVNQRICCRSHASYYQAITTMIVCPQCGDKRCARAASCDAECEALANNQETDDE